MFERYTEDARKAVLFGRQEASLAGGTEIRSEDLLLGIFRVDANLAVRLLHSPAKVQFLRQQLEKQRPAGMASRGGTDLPLSEECKRALSWAAREAENFHHKHIGAEHLLLGVFLEEKSVASKLLRESGVTVVQLKDEASRAASPAAPAARPVESPAPLLNARDLTAAAREGRLTRLVGREREVERAVQILSRRVKNNVAFVGGAGVGKSAIVEGIAQRIADGAAPGLAECAVLAIDASALIDPRRRGRASEHLDGLLAAHAGMRVILILDRLFDLAAGSGWAIMEATNALEPYLAERGLQSISMSTPSAFLQSAEKAAALARHFEIIEVLPPAEEEAIRILEAVKPQFEEFHGVVYGEGTIEAAVRISGRFLMHRYLPERALDLLDEAGAQFRVRRESEPREIVELQARVRTHARNMENSIAKHEFDKAREYSDLERKAREELQRRRDALQAAREKPANVSPTDIEEAVAARAGMPVAAVRRVLQEAEPEKVADIGKAMAARIPIDGHEWVPFLASYLAHCTKEEAEKLVQIIREIKARTA